jgi:hypothetical protein
MNSFLRKTPWLSGILLLAVPLLAAAAPSSTTQPATTKPAAAAVGIADQVQFEQKTVAAQMQELQERMFQLADLTRQTEPDDSSRLLMALRKAREDLIIEQMRDVLDRLSTADLSKAADEQAQVLVKLEELKKLLTSADLDLQMQLQRLKELNAAMVKLDAAIKEEKRQRDQSGALAKAGDFDPKKTPGPQQEQKQNRQTTDTLNQTLKDLGPGPAAAADGLGKASQSMSLAEGGLGSGKPSDAQGLQQQAVDQMQKAHADLQKEKDKILAELQAEVRKQVIQNLTEMLDRQKNVRGASEAAAGHPTGDPTTIARVQTLAPAEAGIIRICDQTSDLIDQTEFSVALPDALKEIRGEMSLVGDQLQTGVADAPLVTNEKQIEADLQDLLDTFKQLASDPGPAGECHCKGNKNKLLAELKVIRMMQSRVNTQTAKADADRAKVAAGTPPAPDPAMEARITGVHDRQLDVLKATEAIHAELTGGN